jgi:hypothetical protein
MFEPAWSTRTVEDDPGAPFFNDTTKYVVSGTLTNATWRNSKIIGPYDPDTIRKLKEEHGLPTAGVRPARPEATPQNIWSAWPPVSTTS